MNPPVISCIVPVFNGERYLGEALESVRAQTYRPLEIIVADDGSTDGTAAAVARYGVEIRYLWQPNLGPAAARNLGLRTAQGEFVAFLDQDDLWHPEKLARQMARFQTNAALDVCATHLRRFWAPELRQTERDRPDRRRAETVAGYVTGTLLARRTCFDTVGPFNIALWFGDATEWFLRAAEQDLVMELLPDVLLYHRVHDGSLSRRMASGSLDEYLRILKASLDRRRRHHSGAPPPYAFPASGRRGKV